MRLKMFKDERAFTGLEAAIVLIAFVTVAAVFSYVMLGAGFFATQKGQEVVHTGVKQVTTSLELAGSVIGEGNTTTNKLTGVKFTLQLASGAEPIDLSKTVVVVYTGDGGRVVENTLDNFYTSSSWFNAETTPDDYLEVLEKVEIHITGLTLDPNEEFMVEIKPPAGASYPMELTVPANIDDVMVLL
jgi:flagellin FlaB